MYCCSSCNRFNVDILESFGLCISKNLFRVRFLSGCPCDALASHPTWCCFLGCASFLGIQELLFSGFCSFSFLSFSVYRFHWIHSPFSFFKARGTCSWGSTTLTGDRSSQLARVSTFGEKAVVVRARTNQGEPREEKQPDSVLFNVWSFSRRTKWTKYLSINSIASCFPPLFEMSRSPQKHSQLSTIVWSRYDVVFWISGIFQWCSLRVF